MSFPPLRSPVARSMVDTAAIPWNDEIARDNAASTFGSPAMLAAATAALCGSSHTARDVAVPTGAPADDRNVTTRFPRAGRADIRVRSQPFTTASRATILPAERDGRSDGRSRSPGAHRAEERLEARGIVDPARRGYARRPPGMRGAPGLRAPHARERARGGTLRASRRSRSQPVESFGGRDLRCGVVPERSRQRHAGRARRTGAAQRRLEIPGRVVLALHRVRPAASAGRSQRGGGYSRKQRRRGAQDGRVVRECTCRCQDGGRRDDGERPRSQRQVSPLCRRRGRHLLEEREHGGVERVRVLPEAPVAARHLDPGRLRAARRAGGARASGR